MASFSKSLPNLLQSTHVVLEARDARLPLTSINPAFESLLGKWFQERGGGVMGPVERIVVYNKADLVPPWGIQVSRYLVEQRTVQSFFTYALAYSRLKGR
jgi:mitochondrial GTPase 1